jgi:F0F1-type ATP synthase membrane subunit b/b'
LDSSLVDIVKDLEAHAEGLLREAQARAASERAETMKSTDALVSKIETEAAEEARSIRAGNQAELEKELAESIALARSSLDQSISKAKLKLGKAVQIVLERLLGS